MDQQRFDDFTRALATPRTRRGFLATLAAAAGALIGGQASAAPPADKPTKCYGEGSHCTNGNQCCSGTCTNRRCSAPPAPECTFPTDCPGSDTECRTRTCVANTCGFANSPAGIPTSEQTAGDCRRNVCDGAGQITSIPDDSDLPNDTNGCTTDTCMNGSPLYTPRQAGTPCGDGGGTVCNETGTCVGCLVPSDCPGQDTECQQRTCNEGVCGVSNVPNGTPTSQQTAGDCRQNVCDGQGGIISVTDDTDEPAHDGNQCMVQACAGGSPVTFMLLAGSPCSHNGGTMCNASGQCVECLTGADCPSGVCNPNNNVCGPLCTCCNDPRLGTSCTVGEGPCQRTGGTYVCSADKQSLVCVGATAPSGCDTPCPQGYEWSGTACVDIDECESGAARCDPLGGVCTNTDGSYTCTCDEGYIGDGYNCTPSPV